MTNRLLPEEGRLPFAAPLDHFADIVETVSRMLVWLAGASLIAMAFLVTVEALLRKFAGFSLGSIDEIVMYVFAASATCSFGYALFKRAHIRIEIIRGLFPPAFRSVMDIFAWTVFAAVFSVLAYYAVDLALSSYEMGARSVTVLRIPMVWPQGFWAVGLAFTALAAFAVAARAYARRTMVPLTPVNEVDLELSKDNDAA